MPRIRNTLANPNGTYLSLVGAQSPTDGGALARTNIAAASLTLATALPVTRLRAVAIGDSRCAGGVRSPDGTVVQVGNTWSAMDAMGIQWAGPQSWFTWACLLSGGRLQLVYNAGIFSDTTTGMLARFTTDVINKAPQVVFLGDAHNDFSLGSGISTTQTRANVVAMIKAAQAAGIMPILYTCMPENQQLYTNAIKAHNAWLKRYAAQYGLIVVDLYAACVDPANASGNWLAANTSDGTHANTAGAMAAASRVLADLAGLLRGNTTAWGPFVATDRTGGVGRNVTLTAATTASTTITASAGAFTSKDVGRVVTGTGVPAGTSIATYVSSTQVTLTATCTISNGTVLTLAPHVNLIQNPLGQDDINSDGIADGFTVNGTVTKTLITDAAVLGNIQSCQITSGTSTGYDSLNVDGLNFSVGDRIKWAGLCKVTGAAGSLNFDLQIGFPGVPTYIVKPLQQTVSTDVPRFYFEAEAVIPVGATSLRCGYQTYAGTGTVELAQRQIVNLTAQGLVSV